MARVSASTRTVAGPPLPRSSFRRRQPRSPAPAPAAVARAVCQATWSLASPCAPVVLRQGGQQRRGGRLRAAFVRRSRARSAGPPALGHRVAQTRQLCMAAASTASSNFTLCRAQIAPFGRAARALRRRSARSAYRRECARLRSPGPITLREAGPVRRPADSDRLSAHSWRRAEPMHLRPDCSVLAAPAGFRSAWLDDSLPWRPTQVI